MKKLIVFVLTLTFMLSVAGCESMRDGTMDTLELDEISDYTQEQLEERLIGRLQEDIHNGTIHKDKVSRRKLRWQRNIKNSLL